MKLTVLFFALTTLAVADLSPEAKERLLVAHRIHCAFHADDPSCKDENERKAAEVRAEWENRAKAKSAPIRAYPAAAADYDADREIAIIRERGRQTMEVLNQPKRERPRQVVCNTYTTPGPTGPTYYTVCQ